jgi:sarcosine oxidase subunit gamma
MSNEHAQYAADPADIVSIEPIHGLTLLNLRGDAGSGKFRRIVRHELRIDLPQEANTMDSKNANGVEHALLWLGPDEWLVKSTQAAATLAPALQSALAAEFAAVTDVSSAYAVFRLSGARVPAVLQAGCPLDLHPRVFAEGQCAQSHFFKAQSLLWREAGEGGGWMVMFRRSFAEYAMDMLLDATQGAPQQAVR